jgi:hypothetical protein
MFVYAFLEAAGWKVPSRGFRSNLFGDGFGSLKLDEHRTVTFGFKGLTGQIPEYGRQMNECHV